MKRNTYLFLFPFFLIGALLMVACLPAEVDFAKTVVLNGVVWLDANDNGLRERDEKGLVNVDVIIKSSAIGEGGTQELNTTTDAFGKYEFYNIEDYQLSDTLWDVTIIPNGNETFTKQDVGNDDTIDSDVDPETGQATATLGEKIDAGLVPGEVADTEPPPVEEPGDDTAGDNTEADPPTDDPAGSDPENDDPGGNDTPSEPVAGSTTLCTDQTLAPALGQTWYPSLKPILAVADNSLILGISTAGIPEGTPFCAGFDGYSDDLPQLGLTKGCATCEKTSVSIVACRDERNNVSVLAGFTGEDKLFNFWDSDATVEATESIITVNIPLDELIDQIDWLRVTGSDLNSCWTPNDFEVNNGFIPIAEVSPELAEGFADFEFTRVCTTAVCFNDHENVISEETGEGTFEIKAGDFEGTLTTRVNAGSVDDFVQNLEAVNWVIGETYQLEEGRLPFQISKLLANGDLIYGFQAAAQVGSPENPVTLSYLVFGPNPVFDADQEFLGSVFNGFVESSNLVFPSE